jgi:hypothetical protein
MVANGAAGHGSKMADYAFRLRRRGYGGRVGSNPRYELGAMNPRPRTRKCILKEKANFHDRCPKGLAASRHARP